jgi:hypothetical protein
MHVDTLIPVLIVAFIAPIVMNALNNRTRRGEEVRAARQRKVEKEEDWARQDRVAADAKASAEAAKAAADLVAVQAAEAARLLLVTNEQVAQSAANTAAQLSDIKAGNTEIHGLVNSQMTAEMKDTRLALMGHLASLNEIVDMNKKLGIEPSPEALATIEAVKDHIDDLTVRLGDREKQAAAIVTQVAEDQAKPREEDR